MPRTYDFTTKGAIAMRRIPITLLAIITITLIPGSINAVRSAAAEQTATQEAPRDIKMQSSLPEAGGDRKLRVFAGRSMIVQSRAPMKRVSITDPAIASTVVVSPTQLMIHGLKPGTVTLLLWDEQERSRSFDLQVEIDTRPIKAQLKQLFPDEKIEADQSGAAIILNGEVASQHVIDKAVALAQTHAPSVVSTMWVREPPGDTILLQVKFAEVDRSAVQELGASFFSTGAANTIGAATTQQFGGGLLTNSGAVPADVEEGSDPNAQNLVSGGIGRTLAHTPSVFGLNDLLNIFIFRADVNLGMVIRAMQQKNLLQILAEPNLLAANGKEASFLAGGEFPFPVIQSGQNNNAVTIQWREFGIRLNFLANALDDGRIRLKVAPEVSSLDYSNALTISGFLIPAMTSRKAATEVELKNGQSFAVAGLMDNRMRDTYSKIPGLGDIPILGKLFQSKATNKSNTELMVLVTPVIVKPFEPGQEPPLPAFPEPFLHKEIFDKARPGHSDSSGAR